MKPADKGKIHFVVTAGPTREFIDPVRFLSNPSTGRMGFAVARAAARGGYGVTLVAGPVVLKTPAGVRRVDVVSARDMLAAVDAAIDGALEADPGARVVFVATAAVADWRPAECAATKLKKAQMDGVLRLVYRALRRFTWFTDVLWQRCLQIRRSFARLWLKELSSSTLQDL